MPPKVPPRPPGGTASISSARPVTPASGQPAADRLARDEQVGLDPLVVLDRPDLARAPRAGLHLVVDVEDPVRPAHLRQPDGEIGRHRHEAALALDGLEHDARDRLRVDVGLEELREAVERVLRGDAVVRVGRGRAVDLGGERPEARLVRVHLARHRHRQQRPPVERLVEHDHGGPAGCRARDLHGVLHRLGTRVDEDRLLVRADARRQLREQPARLDVRLVDADHEALMEIEVGLSVDRVDDRAESVARVLAGDSRRRSRRRHGPPGR